MALSNVVETPASGFNFENVSRNVALEGLLEGGHTKAPKPMKTGTTIAGVVCKDGVVLGADTRATSGEVVADKMCAKIHYISPNMYCCGAGTAADTEKTTDLLSSNLTIFSMNSGRNPRVVMAVNILQDMLFRYRGQIGASLILGGVDCTGNHLYTVGPYGSIDNVPYLAMGSGDLAALGILEDRFKPNMEGVDYIRPYQESEYKDKRQRRYKYRPGTTSILTEKIVPLELEVVQETVQRMDTA
ncbi:proteasome 20S subunit beta 13a isoform X3 [Oncorhynchus mykiss]|uniref:Proteasome subunit beta n=1 Tax=Oncorhynchus mykiss TaxID=8022 RepID=C1BEK5_ONCMY|nr:proteasome 20S subunit beta 13a isoform X3 [Oncorhynchus mykiss]ACO07458.1 Proteasome subunit beta type 7 precursor [Oncorhynchus mykiss]